MANTDIVNVIITTTADMIEYLLPIIAIMSGITFILTFLLSVTLGWGNRTFKA